MNDFEKNSSDNANTNNDNFYNKAGNDIIQDEPIQSPPPYQAPPTYTTPTYNYSPQPNLKKEKRRHSTAVIIIACVLSALIGIISFEIAQNFPLALSNEEYAEYEQIQSEYDDNETNAVEQPQNNVNITVDETVSSIAEAVALKCTNSVVGIRTTTSVSHFFGSQEQTGDGSGVIYTADGYIITNYHVIEDAVESNRSKIDVFIGNDTATSYEASVIGYNISCDLAVIKINATGLTPIELGNSDELSVGQYVVTIGSPGGLEFMGSVTYGIISGLDRTVSTNTELKLIQTDAAINPGNSGGALLNSEGKLIGINSSKIASVEYEGMGFAIPINAVKEKCDKIISRKDDKQAYLGVGISSTYTSEVLAYYGYPSGAVVSTVASGSPADMAGIKRGDIITEFNGVEITEYTVFTDALYDSKGGDKVKIKIYREGSYKTLYVTLESETTN